MMLGMVYLAPAAEAATASSYISTTYASSLSVKTTKVVGLMEYPSASASAQYTLPANTMLTVKALHKNTSGTYWYEVLFYNMTLYVDATATTMVDHLVGDVTITDELSPASLAIGDSYGLKGNLVSQYNNIHTAYAKIYFGEDTQAGPVLTASGACDAKSYALRKSAVDSAMPFDQLSTAIRVSAASPRRMQPSPW